MIDAIFLLCSERSGSNLISRIFGTHSELCAPGPAHLLRIFGNNAHRYEYSDAAWLDFSRDLQALFHSKVSSWALDKNQNNLLTDFCKTKDIAKCLINIYSAEASECGKKSLFIKENQAYNFIPFIMGSVDRLRFLYMVRDPRDMALSWLRSPLARGGIVKASKVWVHDQENNLKLLAWLKPNYLTTSISYESLLNDPKTTLKLACNQLQMTYETAMLSFNSSPEALLNSAASVDWYNTRKPLMKNNTQKFHKGLNQNQIAYIEHVCGPLMDVLSYNRVTNDEAPFGEFQSFKELEQSLISEEPWDKPAYEQVPEREKQQRKRWSKIRDKIIQRPICSQDILNT